MRKALTIVIALVGLAAHAAPHPDAPDMVRAYVTTKRCMTNVGQHHHRAHVPAGRVQMHMVTVCAGPLLEVFLRDMPAPKAQTLMMRIARTTYYEDVLRVEEPPLQHPDHIIGK